MKLLSYPVILLFLLPSCAGSATKKEKEYLMNAFQKMTINGHYKWMVILPGIGCHGCIQEGEYFLKSHVENNEIFFVLTKTTSLKILQQKTETDLNDRQNVLIDKELIFNIPTQNNIYPCVVFLKDGKYVSHSFQSPGATALYDLEKLF